MPVKSLRRLVNKIFGPPNKPIELTPFQRKVAQSSQAIRALRESAEAQRTFAEKFADWMVSTFGNIWFLTLNVIFFIIWMTINNNLIPGIRPFDKFPYGLLTMMVSLEAIILTVFVLISQNREKEVDDLREEIDLQVDLITETELTKALSLLKKIAEKQGIDISNDMELEEMQKPLNTEELEKILSQEIKSQKE